MSLDDGKKGEGSRGMYHVVCSFLTMSVIRTLTAELSILQQRNLQQAEGTKYTTNQINKASLETWVTSKSCSVQSFQKYFKELFQIL